MIQRFSLYRHDANMQRFSLYRHDANDIDVQPIQA